LLAPKTPEHANPHTPIIKSVLSAVALGIFILRTHYGTAGGLGTGNEVHLTSRKTFSRIFDEVTESAPISTTNIISQRSEFG
jgi:hypothetical protein